MITIFNGRLRAVGMPSQRDVYVQVSVKLRAHLHIFKGARLAVFMAIALHSDEEGWSNPSLALLCAETGYNKGTVSVVLAELCAVELEGTRVLLVDRQRNERGTYIKNRYLVFPSAEECTRYEEHQEPRKPRKQPTEPPAPDEPYTGFPDMVQPDMVQPDMVNPYGSITIPKDNHIEPPPPTAPPKNNGADGGGGGGYEKEVRRLLASMNIMAGRQIAEQYAQLDPRPDIETIRQSIENLLDPSNPRNLAQIARRLQDDPPVAAPYARPTKALGSGGPSNGFVPIPDNVLSPEERRAVAARLRPKKDQP